MYGELYRKAPDGLLMKCVPEDEGVRKIENLHNTICGDSGPSLYRRMQCERMFLPMMKMHCDIVQRTCRNCCVLREESEVNAVEEDWRTPLKKFFESGELPIEPREAEKLKKKEERYFYKEGELFKNSFTSDVLRLGYYCPSMKEDTMDFDRKCKYCQRQGNLIHAPAEKVDISSHRALHKMGRSNSNQGGKGGSGHLLHQRKCSIYLRSA
ncbi:hypothetical protein SESBI_12620 [Sesbania bispinosa]|nr:hypothetical protein SESBI_12620 [Sesbania bispinosa]